MSVPVCVLLMRGSRCNACGSMMLMAILMLGGFVLPRGQIHGWWIWGYWIGTHSVMSVRMCVHVLARSMAGGYGATGLLHIL